MSLKFENLIVWQKSLELSLEIHNTTKKFPKEELFILTSQIKRACDSISMNIAEGSQGQSDAEFKRFLGIAIRSAVEVIACLHLAKKRSILDESSYTHLYSKTEEIIKMLQSLKKSLKPQIKPNSTN